MLEFDNTGAHDTFAVSGTAHLDGQLVLVPEPGWYAPDWRLDFDRMFSAGETTGAFSEQLTTLASPTLSLRLQADNGVMKLAMARDAGAYSRHGRDGNARAVGRALERVVPQPGEYVALGGAAQAAWVLAGERPAWEVPVAAEPAPDHRPIIRQQYAARL